MKSFSIKNWLYICDTYISVDTKLVRLWLENPFATWRKARKMFKLPHISCKWFISKYAGPIVSLNHLGKFLDISFLDVHWKDKWDSPRHEQNPVIWFILFKRFHFCINFTIPVIDDMGKIVDRSMEYWEYLLDYLYYSKSLKVNTCWQYDSKLFKMSSYDKDGNKISNPYPILIQPQMFSLTKTGFEEFRKLYENDK